MTQEDKQVLLIDLCSRFPYGVKVRTFVGGEIRNDKKELSFAQVSLYKSGFEDIKPYLFPLSSMTFEQECKYREVIASSLNHYEVYDWFNKNHFDYRGLIEKGLAIDCTNLNIYNYE